VRKRGFYSTDKSKKTGYAKAARLLQNKTKHEKLNIIDII
jgi:hypothetical protein